MMIGSRKLIVEGGQHRNVVTRPSNKKLWVCRPPDAPLGPVPPPFEVVTGTALLRLTCQDVRWLALPDAALGRAAR